MADSYVKPEHYAAPVLTARHALAAQLADRSKNVSLPTTRGTDVNAMLRSRYDLEPRSDNA